MTVFFTSDTHFGHTRALKCHKRPWTSVAAMDDGMVERWNSVVHPNDTVYHLGDFGFGLASRLYDLFQSLNGHKFLIRGNHDTDHTLALPWEGIYDLHKIRVGPHRFVLCHYPLLAWERMERGYIQLHGHQHNRHRQPDRRKRRYDVGVDAWNYTPVSADVLMDHAESVPPPSTQVTEASRNGFFSRTLGKTHTPPNTTEWQVKKYPPRRNAPPALVANARNVRDTLPSNDRRNGNDASKL
jgi:calcineurin-like phosphoesterase family protein